MNRPANLLTLSSSSLPTHPARRLVECMILMAIHYRASAIRFEPSAAQYRVHMTVNGIDNELIPPPPQLAGRIARIFLVMAEMDVTRPNVEQTRPLYVAVGSGLVEMQVNVGPIEHGHAVRVEFRSNMVQPLEAETVLNTFMGPDRAIEFTEDDF